MNIKTIRTPLFSTTFLILSTLAIFSATAQASEFVYQPQNTAFGGQNASATQLLMSKAQAQDTLKNPDRVISEPQTAIERFQASLERRILDQIAREIVSGVFDNTNSGDDLETPGSFTTEDFAITVNDSDPDVISVSIVEFAGGGETSLEIPKF